MRPEVIGIIELDSFRIIIIAQYQILANPQVNLASNSVAEIETVASATLDRIEINAHSCGIGLRGIPPIEFDPDLRRMRMIIAQFLMLTGCEHQQRRQKIK